MKRNVTRVLVSGGGTGGHLFPGLALVEEMRRRQPAIDVLFVGTERGIESKVLPKRGERIAYTDVMPLRGKSLPATWSSLRSVPRSIRQAGRIVDAFAPDIVVGLGGYASAPAVIAASLRGITTALLEQNATMGLANKLLLRRVHRAYLGQPLHDIASMRGSRPLQGALQGSKPSMDDAARRPVGSSLDGHGEASDHASEPRSVRIFGNPVRRSLVQLARWSAADPEGRAARARRILVLGGSQGARPLNLAVPQWLAASAQHQTGASSAGPMHGSVHVLHQTGEAMCAEVRASYERLGIDAEVVPFIEDMARAYAEAKLVIARAGATTVAELCAVGCPSVLIPFEKSAGDHQRINAMALQEHGACVCLTEDDLRAGRTEAATRLLHDDEARLQIARSARSVGMPDTAATIVDDLFACWMARQEQKHGQRAGRHAGWAPALLGG